MNIKKIGRLKVITVLGTRPEIIRLSCILPMLDKYTDHKVIYTNQNYDYLLSGIFFKELGLNKPEYVLDVKSKTLGEQIAKILQQTEKVFLKERPDLILILGDTNSSLSAIVAKRSKIPIFHMEAGNRSFDWDVPEEINRRIVDHISDFNLAYTEHSRRYLLRENVPPQSVFVTGSPLAEVFEKYRGQIESSDILKRFNLEAGKYFVVSVHREENVDDNKNLFEVFSSLNIVAEKFNLPVIVTLHPRTKKRFSKIRIDLSPLIRLNKPFGFFDYNKLQKNSLCVLSDSGSIQEESAIFGFKAIQIRKSTERPEAFDSGSIILAGLEKNALINAISFLVDPDRNREEVTVPNNYTEKNVSVKVIKLILGLGSISKSKKNI